ncbi:hypothetical protein DUNSADRAFT_10996 [Dunaliella salina]|uniref:TIR domain-containing protein n=1 Tax=Dunaliella salina TaxID=3046 RepID=A0ABQ7GEB5_DUNSA|nr:hypothetical protein DUNSADRAFT_10996 [Dunaliella salina]|eukprot:KAF5832950.1 hypothetical protein DUNSADRAFT_10996 [Dunaliella salina]
MALASLIRPLPFLWHIFISGAAEVTVMAQVLKSALQSHAAPARVPRVSIGSGAEADRRAMIKQAACVILILSPNVWQDEPCLSDLSIAVQLGKKFLLVQDPDSRMPTHITPAAAMGTAPPHFRSLFEQNDVFSMYRRWFEQQAFLVSLFQVADLHSSIPHNYEQDQFVDIMEQKKSDVKELAMLKAGLWQYYEGFAERSGKLWGFYQVDAKFMPTLDLIELAVQFTSRSPESIPGYVAVFIMDWDKSSGDVAIREKSPRWQGKLDGGTGGTFHLQNKYADNLTFEPRPFVWHFFLSHIQRESSDMCGALVAKLEDLSPLGRKARVWYDQQAAAVINRCHGAWGKKQQEFHPDVEPLNLQVVVREL